MNIKTISELAGVSPTAVSFVLNNKQGVSEETRRKVLEIIEQENYVPNINSRRLSLKKSFNIAFINSAAYSYTMFSDLFASKAVQAAVEKATELGYHILLIPEDEVISTDTLKTLLSEGNIDGVAVMHDISPTVYVTLSQRKIPLVAIDAHARSAPYPRVIVDYEHLAYKVCRYLIDHGHKKIAYLGLGYRYLPDFYLSCLQGYKQALSEEQLPIDGNWILNMDDDGTNIPEAAKIAGKNLLSCPALPTAVFCANDLVAIGLVGGLKEEGLSVPDDISVISIDDIYMARFFVPPLTTVHVDGAEMGRKAIEMLHKMIEKEEVEEVVEIPEGELIERSSVKRQE